MLSGGGHWQREKQKYDNEKQKRREGLVRNVFTVFIILVKAESPAAKSKQTQMSQS